MTDISRQKNYRSRRRFKKIFSVDDIFFENFFAEVIFMKETVLRLEENFIGNFVIAAEKIADKIEKVNRNLEKSYLEILEDAKNNSVDKENMTLEEYKNFVTEKILQTSRHFSRFKDDISVVLTDKTFAAMKNNSEYESWVLNRLKDELNFPDYLCFYPGNFGRSETFQFGETQEDYRGYSIGKFSARKNFQSQEKSYWELRLEKLKKRLEAEQEYFLERQQLIKANEQTAERRAIENSAIGLDDETKTQLPITGVPANILLDLLT